jgi:IS30 family transposase
MSGRVIGGQRAAIPSEPSKQQGDLCHTRHPRVTETLRQPRNHPQQKRKEGDLIVGPGSASAMVTLRERKTHYGIIINLPADHTAATTNEAITRAFATLPSHLKRTLTWDQGVEMARHQELAAATGLRIYFAERSSPWQRGANENFNGLARQYFPKSTDLSGHSEEHVKRVCTELNTRPRKGLGYLTPAAKFRAERQLLPAPCR